MPFLFLFSLSGLPSKVLGRVFAIKLLYIITNDYKFLPSLQLILDVWFFSQDKESLNVYWRSYRTFLGAHFLSQDLSESHLSVHLLLT